MTTKLTYLSDTYQVSDTAKIVDSGNNEHGDYVILDHTIFYPQGGGQPYDTGMVGDFTVNNVRLSPEGIVYHYGTGTKPNIGDDVSLSVDEERRLNHARIHSAGHLIDIAVKKSSLTGLKPTKGFHDPAGAYVEFAGITENPSDYIEELEKILADLVAQDITIHAVELSPREAKVKNVYAPEGKSARFVYFEGYESIGCGCGGTHTKSTKELGTVTIRKIKSKKGVTRISYQVT